MNDDWILILQWADIFTGNRECHRFAGIPLLNPAQIAIVGEAARISDCRNLFSLLNSRISFMSSNTNFSNRCGGPMPMGCMARDEPECNSLLVALLTDQQITAEMQTLIADWQSSRPKNSIVLPIIPTTADPNVVLPSPLNQLIVLREQPTMDALVPDIFKAVGIGNDEFRLFISYRRADSIALADQLFDEFSRYGFDVFVDRFRGTPGRNFPPLLNENLVDKGLVIVLESPNVDLSPWTQAEVQFANNFRLGLIALRMPGGRTFNTIPMTDRFNATSASLWQDSLGNTDNSTLSDASLFVDFVRSRYAIQTLRRQVYLESLLGVALAMEGLSSVRQTNGTHRISCCREYVVGLSSRPPVLDSVRRICDAAQSTTDQQVVVGPAGFLPPLQLSNMTWLTNRLRLAMNEETYMIQLSQSMNQGQSMP